MQQDTYVYIVHSDGDSSQEFTTDLWTWLKYIIPFFDEEEWILVLIFLLLD